MKEVSISRKLLIGIVVTILIALALTFSLTTGTGAEETVSSEDAEQIEDVASEVAPLSTSGQLHYEPEEHSEHLTEGLVGGLQFSGVSEEDVENSPFEKRVTGDPKIVDHGTEDGTQWAKVEIPVEIVDKESGEVTNQDTMWIYLDRIDGEWLVRGIHYAGE